MGSLAKDHNFALEQVALKRSYQIIPYPLLSGEVVYILLYLGGLQNERLGTSRDREEGLCALGGTRVILSPKTDIGWCLKITRG